MAAAIEPEIGTSRPPIASVIIPVYNGERFITAALCSVLEQDLQDIEILVVNDGSTDATVRAVQAVQDPRVRLLNVSNSGGPSVPRNEGLAASAGEYLFLFDADDLMLPGKLRRSIELLEGEPDAGILFTNFQMIDAAGNILRENYLRHYRTLHRLPGRRIDPDAVFIDSVHLLAGLSKANFIGTSSVALRRTVFRTIGGFDERLKNGDDYDYWVRTCTRFNGIFLNRKLHKYRTHPASISRTAPIERLQNRLLVHESHARSPVLPEAFRANSVRKYLDQAQQLVKDCLKAQRMHDARKAAWGAVRMQPYNLTSYPYLLLALLPAWITSTVLALRRDLIRTETADSG